MSTNRDSSPLGAAATFLDKLGVVDLVVPVLRSRLQRIDSEAVMDEAIDYVRRNPEVLVALLGSLTVMTGLIVFLVRRAEEEERERRNRENSSAKQRAAKKRRA